MSEYIRKDLAIDFCDRVLSTDHMHSIDIKRVLWAYKAYLENLKGINLVLRKDCSYSHKVETPVGTHKYECLFHDGWMDGDFTCGYPGFPGKEIERVQNLRDTRETFTEVACGCSNS